MTTVAREPAKTLPRSALPVALVILVALMSAARLIVGLDAVAALVGGVAATATLGAARRYDGHPARAIVVLGAAAAAAWFAARPPWGDVAAAVLWSGALIIASGIVATRRGEGAGAPGVLLGLGLLAGLLSGRLAAEAGGPAAVALALVLVTGRFAAWSVLDVAHGRYVAPIVLFAVAVPMLGGLWGLVVAGVEALVFFGAARIDARASAWPFALGGAGALLGSALTGGVL